MEEENHGLHQEVSSFMSEVSITVSLFFTYQQVRQLRKERTHSQHMVEQAQQRTRKMGEENCGLQQQVSLHDDIDCKIIYVSSLMYKVDAISKWRIHCSGPEFT